MTHQDNKILTENVHSVLAHSYAANFALFLFGIFLHFMWPVKISANPFWESLGTVFLVLATALVFWAQATSRKLHKADLSKESFSRGPYRFSRIPTQWGLFFLTVGFGMMLNSLFILIFSVVSFLVSKLAFIRKEEEVLVKKYGAHYSEYKKSVKF